MKRRAPVEMRKIPLEGLIDMLVELYHTGAKFIDIIAQPDDVQDMLTVIVKDEYMEEEEEQEEITKLSDKDINDLSSCV